MAALGMVMVVGVTGVACSSTGSGSTTTTGKSSLTSTSSASSSSGGSSKIPSSAFSDHTGVTSNEIHIGNVSTLLLGIFKGAPTGVQAYADYVNSTGGVNGRKVVVDGYDDSYSATGNLQKTQAAVASDIALVGDFSTYDAAGGTVLAKSPGVPDVSVTLDPATSSLSNVFSPVPVGGGWELGPLQYYKQKFPQGVKAVGALIADQSSAEASWNGEKAAMEHVGFKVLADPTYAITAKASDFTQLIIQMRNSHVKMLFLEQMPAAYASTVMQVLTQQNYHPVVVFGASTYAGNLLSASGAPPATNGAYLEQNASLYLGSDRSSIPAVATFQHWAKVADPSVAPDLFMLYGWLSAELFVQGLKNAGSNPSRGSLLAALSKITAFNGGNIIAPTNPAAKTLSNCYLLAQAENGQFQRIADPPLTGSTHGYRCDYQYYVPPGS